MRRAVCLATLMLSPFAAGFRTHGARPTGVRASSGRIRKPRMATAEDAASDIRPASACWIKEQGSEMLQRFGSAFEDTEEKVYAYENLLLSQSKDALLDAAILEVASVSSSSWLARSRYPVRLPSRRATIGCYGRLMAEMDGGRLQIESMSERTVPEAGPAERRRLQLLQLLEWCAYGRGGKGGGVWKLEGDMLAQTGRRRIEEGFGSATD